MSFEHVKNFAPESAEKKGKTPRWVIKLGTGILSRPDGSVDLDQIESLVGQVLELRKRGHQVILVSSGAIGSGMGLLGITERPTVMAELQACAALGQPYLIQLYNETFARHGLLAAQILVTYLELDSRSLYANIQASVEHLLALGKVVPIFNENDVVSYEEIIGPRFGDNDQLSAHIAVLSRADRLIILSNIPGLMTKPDGTGRVIREVFELDEKILELAGGTQSQTSVGGMVSKLKAARVTREAGILMQIAHGREKNVLISICNGEPVGTIFYPHAHA